MKQRLRFPATAQHPALTSPPRTQKVSPTFRRGRLFKCGIAAYGLGDELVVVVVEELPPLEGDEPVLTVVLLLSVLEELPPAGDDLSITVVLLSVFFSPGGFVTVVSFCSQAARKATLSNKQMYFIILSYSHRSA